MTRHAYISHANRTILFWSAKAGNTSLGDWLLRADSTPDQVERVAGVPARSILSVKGVVDSGLARELIETLDFDHYVLCRNPYDRAVSAYWDKLVAMGRSGRMNDFSRKFLHEVAGDQGEDEGISFRQFLEHVLRKVAGRGDGEPRLNHHFNTQVPFAYGDFEYRNVLRLETIADDIELLKRKFDTNEDFPRLRRRLLPAGKRPADDLSDVKSVELMRPGHKPSRSQFLNDDTRAMIAEAYAIDFRKFNYPTELRDGGTEARS